jgi:hypothetical protein
MFRSSHLLLTLALLGPLVTELHAQAPATLPSVPAPAANASSLDFLKELPQPPDVPASLMEPAPPQIQTADAAEAPYFQLDPLLDPPHLPQPGWFVAAEAQLTRPRVLGALVPETPAVVPGVGPVVVSLGAVPLDWTVGPKLSAGYRLPSGFGDLLMSYRFFNTQGSNPIVANPNTGLFGASPAMQTSRLSLNQLDLDYSSREYTPYARLGMRWWLGLRFTDFSYNATAIEPGVPFGNIDAVRVTDFTLGIGVHAGVEVDWKLPGSGLFIVNKLDVATNMAKNNESFDAESSTLGTGGASRFSRSTQIPYVNYQLGLGWQPPVWSAAHFFMGYQFEHWWQMGFDRSGSIGFSRLDLENQGVVWQATFNF